jgi:hypothetical protein
MPDEVKRDWKVWVKWIGVVLVTALVARYTGREVPATPPPPEVLPFEARTVRAAGHSGEVSGRVELVSFSPGETGDGAILYVQFAGYTPEWERRVWVSAEYRPGKFPTFDGKPVKTNKELVSLLLESPRVRYTGSPDPTTYGVHTEGRFDTPPADKK